MNPGLAATAVCREALRQGSKDNLSCMIVLFGGGEEKTETELIPGPFTARNRPFQSAYAAMAEHADKTLDEALEMRYDYVRSTLKISEADESADDVPGESLTALKAELAEFGDGPADGLAHGSAERMQWFANWLSEQQEECMDGTLRGQQVPRRRRGAGEWMAATEIQL